MNATTIARPVVQMQPGAENGQVYCPMCEIWHENNSWCQAPCIYEPAPQSYSEATQRYSDMTMEGQ